MKFIAGVIFLIITFSVSLFGQQSGSGCEYRGISPYRVYQQHIQQNFVAAPAYEYGTNAVLPINNACFKWTVTGAYRSCYVYDGFFYYPGYAGVMGTLDCPLDDYSALLLILLSPLGVIFLIQKKKFQSII
nr:hypothetical protein [Pedobacter sp. ASV2]